jgi:hypothetical protein
MVWLLGFAYQMDGGCAHPQVCENLLHDQVERIYDRQLELYGTVCECIDSVSSRCCC